LEVRKIPKRTITVIEPTGAFLVDKKRHDQKRVAAYCRVSTGDEEQLTSFKNQKKVYTEMIASNPDWELVDIYAEIKTPKLIQFNDFREWVTRGG